jgi:hypothetical protein
MIDKVHTSFLYGHFSPQRRRSPFPIWGTPAFGNRHRAGDIPRKKTTDNAIITNVKKKNKKHNAILLHYKNIIVTLWR